MNKHHRKSLASKGFTIIEIMIVLAIAGLIMLIVFLAVPTVQKTVRDTGRKQVASTVSAELNDYRVEHSLSYPDTANRCAFIKTYLRQYADPTAPCVDGGCTQGVLVKGYSYSICFHEADTSPHSYLSTNQDEISIQTGHWCSNPVGVSSNSGDPIFSSGGNDLDLRYGVVWVSLERARMFCIDNH